MFSCYYFCHIVSDPIQFNFYIQALGDYIFHFNYQLRCHTPAHNILLQISRKIIMFLA